MIFGHVRGQEGKGDDMMIDIGEALPFTKETSENGDAQARLPFSDAWPHSRSEPTDPGCRGSTQPTRGSLMHGGWSPPASQATNDEDGD